MAYTVTVSFGTHSEYAFKFADEDVERLPRDEARRWLQTEFETLECATRSPVGKMLLLDVILDVAKYGGEDRFAAGDAWAKHYALCCASTLERESLRVDVPNSIVA